MLCLDHSGPGVDMFRESNLQCIVSKTSPGSAGLLLSNAVGCLLICCPVERLHVGDNQIFIHWQYVKPDSKQL